MRSMSTEWGWSVVVVNNIRFLSLSKCPMMTHRALSLVDLSPVDLRERTKRPGRTFPSRGTSSFRITLKLPHRRSPCTSSILAFPASFDRFRSSFTTSISVISIESSLSGE